MSGLKNIEHVVVVMLENRSFDNLLGWLYGPGDLPAKSIPAQPVPGYDGLRFGSWSNSLGPGQPPVPVTRPPTAWPGCPNPYSVPTPDPNEPFDHVTRQIFGTANPEPGAAPTMGGFLADYATADRVGPDAAGQIMQTYGPGEAGVINELARAFAVSDRWFASVPSQTWPNRAFVHTGSSDGHLNNDDYELYDIPTVFETLQTAGKSWAVYHDTDYLPSLTLGQFMPRLLPHADHFARFKEFKRRCAAPPSAGADRRLPQYSFVEPRFQAELGWFRTHYPNDYHPPHDVCRGEDFLSSVYSAVRNSPCRDRILLVVTFDEHGGCYDHAPPPGGAEAPQPQPVSRDGRFRFDRFGIRVPTLVISSYVTPGTVFRSTTDVPYDHTSILATLRDWLGVDPFLPSPRIAAAPTLAPVLGEHPTAAWPAIRSLRSPADQPSLDLPLSDLQQSLIASRIRHRTGSPGHPDAVRSAKAAATYRDAIRMTVPSSRRWLWRLRGVI